MIATSGAEDGAISDTNTVVGGCDDAAIRKRRPGTVRIFDVGCALYALPAISGVVGVIIAAAAFRQAGRWAATEVERAGKRAERGEVVRVEHGKLPPGAKSSENK